MADETLVHCPDVYTGSEPGFYQWSTGVRMRANLDLLLDWANETGLGELASEQTQKLSSAVNLLATPRKNLLQVRARWCQNTARLTAPTSHCATVCRRPGRPCARTTRR